MGHAQRSPAERVLLCAWSSGEMLGHEDGETGVVPLLFGPKISSQCALLRSLCAAS